MSTSLIPPLLPKLSQSKSMSSKTPVNPPQPHCALCIRGAFALPQRDQLSKQRQAKLSNEPKISQNEPSQPLHPATSKPTTVITSHKHGLSCSFLSTPSSERGKSSNSQKQITGPPDENKAIHDTWRLQGLAAPSALPCAQTSLVRNRNTMWQKEK